MPSQFLTPQNKDKQSTHKHEQNSFRNTFRSSNGKSVVTRKSSDDEEQMQKFGKTYFKARMNKINELKFTKTRPIINEEKRNSLEKIEQKLLTHFGQSNSKDGYLLQSQSQEIKWVKSPMKVQHSRQNQNQQTQNEESELSGSQLLQPLSLKKKINMIRKHRQVLQREYHRRRASLQFKQRSVAREEKKVNLYREKFEKIINVRQERSLQRQNNERQIEEHKREIIQQKYYLRSTVLNSQNSLQNSRLSLCIEKMNLANEIRVQKRENMEEVKDFQLHCLSRNKKMCQSIKSSRAKTQQSVESFHQDKRMTINQRKLHEISQQLMSLEKQKSRYITFYREKDENEFYKSRIKQKKEDLQKKAKLYKINLMLELNRNDRLKMKNQQENQLIQLKNSTTTELYRKKRHTVSTEPDLTLLTTTKNNSIYKRWGNSMLASSLNNEEVGDN